MTDTLYLVVTTERAHCIHCCMYFTLILLLSDMRTLCVLDHLIYIYIYIYIYIRYVYITYIQYIYI